MELRQLECFVVVAEEQHIGRAAARLFMTQPPLSRRIQRLEREVGAKLFLRTPSGVKLTPPGEALLDQARRLLAMAEQSITVVRLAESGELGRLNVAYFGSVIFNLVPRVLASFLVDHPRVELCITRLSKADQIQALHEGRIHVGFGRRYANVEGLHQLNLASEPLHVAVPSSHRFARELTGVEASDFQGQPLVLFPRAARPSFADDVIRACSTAGFIPVVAVEAEDVVSALVHVAAGAGIAPVPQSALNIHMPGVRFVPFADSPIQELAYIYRASEIEPILCSLLSFLERWQPDGGAYVGCPNASS